MKIRKPRFRLSQEVAEALALSKLTELRRSSKALMGELEQRKEWARLMVALTPNLPTMFHPEFFNCHYFEKFQRHFALRYNASDHAYILCFSVAPVGVPPGDDNPPEQAPPPNRGGAVGGDLGAHAPVAAPPGPEATLRWAIDVALPTLKLWARQIFDFSVRVRDRVEKAGDDAFRRCEREEQRIVSSIRARMESLHRQYSRLLDGEQEDLRELPAPEADASLGSQRVSIAPGLTLDLPTFVEERIEMDWVEIDWDSFPFGKLDQDEHALA